MEPRRKSTLTFVTLILLMEQLKEIDTSPTTIKQKHERKTTREEEPEEIYRRLEEAHRREMRAKEKSHVNSQTIQNASHLNDDEYTYEYETVEEPPPSTTLASIYDYNRIGTRKSRKPKKDKPSNEAGRKRPKDSETPRKTYAMNSAIVETLQSKKKKSDMTSRDRELAKRNLLRGKPMKAHWGDSSEVAERYADVVSFEKVKAREDRDGRTGVQSPVEGKATVKKEYTYEYETVEKGAGETDGHRGADDEYTYEYETVENKTLKEGGQKTTKEMTSKELFEKQLADYHAEQDARHRRRFPDEYIDKVKVEGLNIKEIKDDTNETLLNYDEHGNFKWRPEWEHLKMTTTVPTTTTTTTSRPYLEREDPVVEDYAPPQLEEYRDSQDRSYSNIYDERLQAKIAKAKERAGGTRHPDVQEVINMIDNMVVTDPTEVTRVRPTEALTKAHMDHLMHNFRQHMSAMHGTNRTNAMHGTHGTTLGTTVADMTASKVVSKIKMSTKRRVATLVPLSTRSLAERAERRERKLAYKKKLLEMKQRREKHQNLFLQLRGFEKYTDAPITESPGILYEEDSFEREYFYLKSERAFKRWLRLNKYRFPQLNADKRGDYEILLRCWDTDIKRARKGIPIVTLYPPPSTFEPSGELHLPGDLDYEYLGMTAPRPVTKRKFQDSLEEAFYRRYDELKNNRTFESLEKIIQDREGPRYRAPQLDMGEFSRKFWNMLLRDEHRDYERRMVDKQRLNRVAELRQLHRDSIEGVASIYERQRWIRLQIKKQLETKSTTIDRRVELDEEGREWFKGVRGITGDLPDEFFLDDKTDLPKHLRWRVELPVKDKKRKIEREKKKEKQLLDEGVISTTSDPLAIYRRLFKPLEMPEWRMGLQTTTVPSTTTQAATETEHWFWSKYAKYFTEDDVEDLKKAYEGVPKKYLTQWMATWCPNLTDFYRIPDDYDPPEWQAKREEYIQYRRKKIKTTTIKDISSDESWITPYGKDYHFTYPTMTITWDYVGPNQTRYFGLLARAKDKVKDRVALDSEYQAQMWDKTDSKLERFDLPRYQCMRCNDTFFDSVELSVHHKEHLKKEKVLQQYLMANGSYTKRKKTVPPNKSYLFYYYSDAEDMESQGVFKPDYPKYG